MSPRGDEACRGIQADDGFRFDHFHPPGFQQGGHDADAVAAGHRMGAIRLQHDEAGVGIRPRRRDQEIHRHCSAGAGLKGDELSEAVIHRIDMIHFLQGRGTWNIGCATDDDLADLTLAMDLENLDRAFPLHCDLLHSNRLPADTQAHQQRSPNKVRDHAAASARSRDPQSGAAPGSHYGYGPVHSSLQA